jgi:hypothetical protein
MAQANETFAATCAVAIECPHGWDVCPMCDGAEAFPGPFPHYHACRPFDRTRKHDNDYPCFDPDDKPERQHEGYTQICSKCQDEFERKYRLPDDGRDESRYGGF